MKANAHRQISGNDWNLQIQYDVASFENVRGSAVRSAILEYYGDASYGVYFRNHSEHRWELSCIV